MRFLKLEQTVVDGVYPRGTIWVNFDYVLTIQKKVIVRSGKKYVYSLLEMKNSQPIQVTTSPDELMEMLKDL